MARIALVGTGLIGGSIGLALTRAGYDVVGHDRDWARAGRALEIGAIAEVAPTLAVAVEGADAVVIAVPVSAVGDLAVEALALGAPAVTDVGSVKAPVVAAVQAGCPEQAHRFVGGHPMAGSEQDDLDGADPDLFAGAMWVLTPTEVTDPEAFATIRGLVARTGAEIVAIAPGRHDALVAVVSHVPQLAATTLMDVAADSGEEHATLLRLAAGGFRDMTRIVAGHPGIWPDICVANREAIVAALDDYRAALDHVRDLVDTRDRAGLLELLERARVARRSLPVGTVRPGEQLVELRVPVPDRRGVLAEVTTLAGERGVNIADLEIAHSMEGRAGVIVMVVSEDEVERFESGLTELGYHPSRKRDHVTELELVGQVPLRGRIRLPGCKGISHRALVFAAVADGRSRITNLAPGDDVRSTARALGALGVGLEVDGDAVVVTGAGFEVLQEPDDVIDCGNSGTTLRFLAGLLSGRASLAVLTGDASLRRRPMGRVVEPLRALGALVDGAADAAHAPLTVRGGGLVGERVELAVASGQVKTALVLAGLQAGGVTEIAEPAPSRDHTERMLLALGAPLERVDDRTLRVRAGSPDAFELAVPGDPSSAAFFAVAAAIVPGSAVVLEDVALNPGRVEYLDVLREMGARVDVRVVGETLGEPFGEIAVEAAPLRGTVIASREAIVDELPVLAVAAAFASGVTEIRDAAELAVKESDRIATLQSELSRLGIAVEPRPDGLVVRGGAPRGAAMTSHDDHRIAMAATVAAAGASGVSTVAGWDAVAVSYPEFADDLRRLRGES